MTKKTKRTKLEIHISDVRQFKTCRRAWFLKSPLRMGLERKVPHHYLFLGAGVHYALNVYYTSIGLGLAGARSRTNLSPTPGEDFEIVHPRTAFDAWWRAEVDRIKADTGGLTPEEDDTFKEAILLGRGMLDHYYSWAQKADLGMTPYSIPMETRFELPLRTFPSGRASPVYVLAGRFDGLLKWRNALWIHEIKTISPRGWTQQLGTIEQRLSNDEQATCYLYALHRLFPDERIGGMLYTHLRKVVPEEPAVLKRTGKYGQVCLSQNLGQDTTVELYEKAIEEYGLDREDYADFLCNLRAKGNDFFARTVVRRTERELKRFERDLYKVVQDMKGVKTLNDAYISPPWWGCGNCDVAELCNMVNNSIDPKWAIDSGYRIRSWHDITGTSADTVTSTNTGVGFDTGIGIGIGIGTGIDIIMDIDM